MAVYNFYRTVIPAHGAGISICRHPFASYITGAGSIDGYGKLAFPVKIAAGMSHLEVRFTGFFEFYHITDMGGNP